MIIMITEDYVGFENAKLLKEHGFDEPCNMGYNEKGQLLPLANWTNSGLDAFESGNMKVTAPTLQRALKWLKLEKKLYIEVHLDMWALGDHLGYYIVIQRTDNDFQVISPHVDEDDTVFFKSSEAATEAAIKYCLENLVDKD